MHRYLHQDVQGQIKQKLNNSNLQVTQLGSGGTLIVQQDVENTALVDILNVFDKSYLKHLANDILEITSLNRIRTIYDNKLQIKDA